MLKITDKEFEVEYIYYNPSRLYYMGWGNYGYGNFLGIYGKKGEKIEADARFSKTLLEILKWDESEKVDNIKVKTALSKNNTAHSRLEKIIIEGSKKKLSDFRKEFQKRFFATVFSADDVNIKNRP